ncbi:MAG: quinone-dependent dihydroorotate dehydrogenase [Candidatus Dadabacteria bacterium]|nr:quinone-dependent dihydroorotate dehydrogenase [Candidatus Dadabacteria bacterium]
MIYKTFLRPVLDRLDSETWHHNVKELMHLCEFSGLTLRFLEFAASGGARVRDKRLGVSVAGVPFENPLIVGAGWDKTGKALRALCSLGFAGVEVGSVVERPQRGNPKPRQFMVTPDVCLNSLGLNSPGMDIVLENLRWYGRLDMPVGINLGINSDTSHEDAPRAYAAVARKFRTDAAYFAINVSSPNTPGLRKLQDGGRLGEIIGAVTESLVDSSGAGKPLFVKISPDLSLEAIDELLRVVIDSGISGVIATNTSDNRGLKAKYGEKWEGLPGGISGNDPEYRSLSTSIISHIYRAAGGELEIIGVGGVCDTASALEKLCAGAKALQVVTGLRGEGFSVANSINRGLLEFMDKSGISDISEIVGSGHEAS